MAPGEVYRWSTPIKCVPIDIRCDGDGRQNLFNPAPSVPIQRFPNESSKIVCIRLLLIVAESFGSIYERNAINAAFPILSAEMIPDLDLQDGDEVFINITTGEIRNNRNKKAVKAGAFSEVQMEIYQNGGLF